MSVPLETFVEEPRRVLSAVCDWLGVDYSGWFEPNVRFAIVPREQHVYVGNRWLFKNPEQPVAILQSDDYASLSVAEKLASRIIFSK